MGHSLFIQGGQVTLPVGPGQGDQVSGPGGAPHLGYSAVEGAVLEVPPQALAPVRQIVRGLAQLRVVVLADSARLYKKKRGKK